MSDLEKLIAGAKARGDLVHLSLVSIDGVFFPSYSTATKNYGANSKDPVAALKEALAAKTKTTRNKIAR